MGLRINPDLTGDMLAGLARDRQQEDQAIQELSTGLKVNQPSDDPAAVAGFIGYAQKARNEGIVLLDRDLEKTHDPFLNRSLILAVDSTEPQELRKMMELELQNRMEEEEKIPMVFEAAGGFSPTIGIIAASLASFR